MRLLSLFSGVGALDAAVQAAFGATVVAHCEADAYCRRVLARHWPGVPCFTDVRTLNAADVGAIDCICGGFPCTDLSTAGKQAGLQAARSGLWWQYLRLVRELRPSMVVIENVPPLYRNLGWRAQVESLLTELGYRVIWTLCKASDVGAPHRRERTFALAVLPGVVVPQVQGLTSSQAGELWPTPTCGEAKSAGNRSDTELTLTDVVVRGKGKEWPTPRREASESTGAHRGVADTLTSATRKWTTPTDRDGNGAGSGPAAQGAEALVTQALWTTPCATEARQGYQRRHGGASGSQISVSTQVVDAGSVGVLNPAWCEPLVGLPIGWTEAEGPPLAIDWAPRWPAGRGEPQRDWEPPRTVPTKSGGRTRRPRLMAIGNIVVPQQAMLALSRLAASAQDPAQDPFGRAQMMLL